MKVSFLGAAKTVTGSLFLLETAHSKIIIDCGMFQGGRAMDSMNELAFPFNVASIDAVILTHAHIDHSGRLPKLVRDGYHNKIIATKPTADLCGIMLRDSAHIQSMEAEWQTRKNRRRGQEAILPLYDENDVQETMTLFETAEYEQWLRLTSDIQIRLLNSGHMLGSTFVEIRVSEADKEETIIFTGDIGNFSQPILQDPKILGGAKYLVMESTYGNRYHKEGNGGDELLGIIMKTLKRGGNVIIPSFAVGRTQDILYELNCYKENGLLGAFASAEVYVDSPLAIQATEIFKKYYHITDEATQKLLRGGDDPLVFENLKYSLSTEDSVALNFDQKPKIIISASGMCDAGRIRHHLKHNLWRSECSVVFVGYQAENSFGRRLIDGEKEVKLFGEDISVKAEIHQIEAFSGHADLGGLLNVITTMNIKPEKAVLVHGEEDSLSSLRDEITRRFGIRTLIPAYGDIFDLSLKDELSGQWSITPLPIVTDETKQPAEKPVTKPAALKRLKALAEMLAALPAMLVGTQNDISQTTFDKAADYIGKLKKLLSHTE